MRKLSNIKIPNGLALQVLNSKSTRKALETYFMLKSISPNGWIKNTVKDLTALEIDLKICYKTIVTRIKILEKMNLVECHKTHITISSYKVLQRNFNTYGAHYLIKIDILKKIKLEDYLIAIAIKEKKAECSKAFYAKHLRLGLDNEIIKGVFNGKKPTTSYKEAVVKAHLTDFVNNANESDLSYAFNFARADVEIGYKRLSKLMGYKGKGSFAYTKRKLQSVGIIDVNKRELKLSTKTHSTKRNRTTALGTINYDRRNKGLNLQLPDQIIINNQTQIINYGNA